jgi:N-terminal acetyltransferase B complex non-catalytic subunit
VLDATFSSLQGDQEQDESVKTASSSHVAKTQELFAKLALQDGHKDRSALLALLELEKRARLHGISNGLDITVLVFRIQSSHYFRYQSNGGFNETVFPRNWRQSVLF